MSFPIAPAVFGELLRVLHTYDINAYWDIRQFVGYTKKHEWRNQSSFWWCGQPAYIFPEMI